MKQNTTKPSNYLFQSDLEFNLYHIQTAELIYSLLLEGKYDSIEEISNAIESTKDQQFVQYAFMDKYGFNYVKKIESMKAYILA
jgi:hypothetical protein